MLLAGTAPSLLGSQTPSIESVPPFSSSAAEEAIELAATAGLTLDPWQQHVLRGALGERADGKWAAFEVGLVVSRQNGKGSILEARELAGLFLFGEQLILHSAHEFKALDVSTPILTSRGWSTMGELRDGDEVYAPDGSLTKVIAAHPVRYDRPCFEVYFDDGQTVVADAEHLWGVTDTHADGFRVLNTAELLEAGVSEIKDRVGRNRRTYRFRVAVTQPLVGVTDRTLPVDPWLLGAWLGDGSTGKGQLTVGQDDLPYVLERLNQIGETYRVRPEPRWPDRVSYVIIPGLVGRLRDLGVLGAKHIPDSYLLANEASRRELLAGIMDTDGTVSAHQIAVTMTKARLMDDVASLVRSLGYKASLREFRARLNGVDAGPMYRVQFSAAQAVSPFGMPRKSAKLRTPQNRVTRSGYNAIVDIRPVETRPTRCITVAHESSMYAVGRGFVPTHNTCVEGFRRILHLIENTPDLDRRVKKVTRSHGDEGIELKTGQRLRFIARSGGSGRGFSGDCIILDEAMILGDEAMGALLPTLSARPNPQVWYTSSAGSIHSTQLARVVRRGRAGGDISLAFFEWSADETDEPSEPTTWAKTNPGMGIRISEEHVAREFAAMDFTEFLRERLGVGTYPTENGPEWEVVPEEAWRLVGDSKAELRDPVVFSVAVTPDRSLSAIVAAGSTQSGKRHIEVIDLLAGTGWVPARLESLRDRWNPKAIALDAGGPAGSLRTEIEARGIELTSISRQEFGQACANFYDGVMDKTFTHHTQPELTTAVRSVQKRPLGDAWAWSRKGSPIVTLEAASISLYVHSMAIDEPDGVLMFFN